MLEERRFFVGLLLELVCRLFLANDQIPLVHDDDEPTAGLPRHVRDAEVLMVQLSLGCVNEQHADGGALDGPTRPQRGVELDAVIDLCLASESRRVHEHDAASVILHWRVDGVARRSGDVAHNQPFLTQKPIHKGRFPDIGPPDDGHAQRGVVLGRGFRKSRDHVIEQITRVLAVGRRYGKRISHAEAVELIPVRA